MPIGNPRSVLPVGEVDEQRDALLDQPQGRLGPEEHDAGGAAAVPVAEYRGENLQGLPAT